MELRTLQTFIQVAHLQSITKAAKELDFAQSTVTMQIKQLENELGFPLFDRIGKHICLTVAGQKFLSQAYEITHILQQAGTLGETVGGILRVGVLESLLFSKLTDLLPAFHAAYPQVELQIKMGRATELKEQLKQNQLDIVYLSDDMNTDPDLICLYQKQETLVLVCGVKHPLAQRTPVSLTDLFEHEFFVTEKSGVCFGRLQKLAARKNTLIKDLIEVDSTVVIRQLLKTGSGLALLPKYAVLEDLDNRALIELVTTAEEQIYYSQLLCRCDRWLSPAMQALTDLIAQCKA